MGVLIRKFPINEAVEWQKFLADQEKSEQNSPFPAFVRWLEKSGVSWELLAASGTGSKNKSGGVQVHHTFYGEEEPDSVGKPPRTCYKCGQTGHFKKDCPKKDHKSTGGGKSPQTNGDRKPRSPPKYKKHHCAYHKDAPGRYCVTWSCPSVKYTQYNDRLKLLRENMDCEICCGDCPKGACAPNRNVYVVEIRTAEVVG